MDMKRQYSFIFSHHFSVRFVLDLRPVLEIKIYICPKNTSMENDKVVQSLPKTRCMSMYTICLFVIKKDQHAENKQYGRGSLGLQLVVYKLYVVRGTQ